MTAELWLVKPCPHGGKQGHHSYPTCDGESRVRLDPDKVVFAIPNDMWGIDDEYTVQDVIDALSDADG